MNIKKHVTVLDDQLNKLQILMLPLKTHSLFAASEEKLKCHLEQFNKKHFD